MRSFFDRFYYSDHGKTKDCNIVVHNDVRFSILSPCLLRVELQIEKEFCDLPTQTVYCRDFGDPSFQTEETNGIIRIRTEKCEFYYSFKKKKMLSILLEDGRKVSDFKKCNLKGTCRTLDGTFGKTALDAGVISKKGVAVLNDSKSLVVYNDGRILPRKNNETDLYYFAYGSDYRGAIRDFFQLTGAPPLIPRYALGNWWSIYKAYTQNEYTELMDRFREKNIPLTVATIDMDWHWVKVAEKFGAEARDQIKGRKSPEELFMNISNPGWTGYSWNTDLFPDPGKFLRDLKARGLHVTMNLHPASGCKFFEDAYPAFCNYMGIDPNTKKQIYFDITDPKFVEGYFRFLHLPHEQTGVDFWWIDWQQGKKTKIPGLDPLWALNHYHYLDNAKDGNRPLILSRYAGAGSHRYPLGFSGDTAQTWKTLCFQPYFTANAANIGYTWWSHDIGGHHFGTKDDELYLRWVQFGIFSPIMRLHSTSNEFMGKEPWKYRGDVEHYVSEALRLRHRLIPYLYTMAYESHVNGRALCEPMYYAYPLNEQAYRVPNQYAFGSQLLVCPITEKIDPKTGLAGTDVWLPAGRYTDLFNGRIYEGERLIRLYRDETSIPVLAKEGAIIPLSAETGNDWHNPKKLEIVIYRGTSEFAMYEDDGESTAFETGAYCTTQYGVRECDKDLCFSVSMPAGDISVIPFERDYMFRFADVCDAEQILLKINGEPKNPSFEKTPQGLCVYVTKLTAADHCEIVLHGIAVRKNITEKEFRIILFSKLQCKNLSKNRFVKRIDHNRGQIPKALKKPLREYEGMR